MSPRIVFVAREFNSRDKFEVDASSMDEARQILKESGFNGYVYEELWSLVSTTPHIVGREDESIN